MNETTLPTGTEAQLATEVGARNVILLIVYLAIILVAAYFVTKYVARRALTKGMKRKPKTGGVFRARTAEPGTLISVADRIAIEKTKTIMVVEFQGKYYLMSTTEHDIKCIDKVDIPPNSEDQNTVNDGAEDKSASYVNKEREYADQSFGEFLKGMFTQFRSKKKVRSEQRSFKDDLNNQVKKQDLQDNDTKDA